MPSQIDLPADMIIDLADHPNIVGIKECSLSVGFSILKANEKRAAISSIDDFLIHF